MSIPYRELIPQIMQPVSSPEQIADQQAAYLQVAQMHGLAQAASGDYPHGLGSCCKSCADNHPCEGGMSGLGGTTVSRGQADLEPGDYGYQYAQTTKPGQTVFGRRQGFVQPDRRIALTRQIEELEFLAATPGVHPRALASKVWEARRALMGAGDWSWASYANPRDRYDAKSDLEGRLTAVERVLGVDQLSPRLMIAYSQGSGLGGIPEWGSPYREDAITRLAGCIRAMICAPGEFCCPSGTRYNPNPVRRTVVRRRRRRYGSGVPGWGDRWEDETRVPDPPPITPPPSGPPEIALHDPTITIVPRDPGGFTSIPGGPTGDPGGFTSIPGGATSIPGGTSGGSVSEPSGSTSMPGGYQELVDALPQADADPAPREDSRSAAS